MYMSDMNIPVQKEENDEKGETTTKGSSSPKKNFRYSRINVHEEEDDQLDSNLIQKALSLPINLNAPTADNDNAKNLENELFDDNKIDEWEEDIQSIDETSEDSLDIPDKQIQLHKRNASEGNQVLSLNNSNVGNSCVNKAKKSIGWTKKKFFIHKANSFKKQETRSRSPVKGVLQNIQNSTRKIKLMKMNSLAFKIASDKRIPNGSGMAENSISDIDEDSETFIDNNTNSIISPIRCGEVIKSSNFIIYFHTHFSISILANTYF